MAELTQVGDMSFPKKRHLRQQGEFNHVYTRATTFVGRLMVVKITPALDEYTRVGFVASKKCDKRAVKRNRARRLLRESFRLLVNGITPSYWVILIARKKILRCRLPEVQKELVNILMDANVFSYKPNS